MSIEGVAMWNRVLVSKYGKLDVFSEGDAVSDVFKKGLMRWRDL